MAAIAITRLSPCSSQASEPEHSGFREPASLVFLGNRLFVANRRSGTVSIVDLNSELVVGESPVGTSLAGIALAPDAGELLAIDERENALDLLKSGQTRVSVVARMNVASTPVALAIAPTRRLCAVSSLWARQVTLVEIRLPPRPTDESRDSTRLQTRMVIDLPFAPRALCYVSDDSKLVVADAFGGMMAVIDCECGRLLSLAQCEGHNIRRLVYDKRAEEILVSQQLLDQRLPATESHISWGGVIANVVRALPVRDLVRPLNDSRPDASATATVRRLPRWRLAPVGPVEQPAADPESMVLSRQGTLFVAAGGGNRVALRREPDEAFTLYRAGTRPVSLALDHDERHLVAANAFDDTISVWRLPEMTPRRVISLGTTPQLTAVDRGKRLFYSGSLSHRNWFSCHSCHTDGHTIGLLNDNLGDQTYGEPRRIPTLLGTGDTPPWAWNGGRDELSEQVRSSLLTTMHGGPASVDRSNVADLVAFLETLVPPPGIDKARGTIDRASVSRGSELFRARNCIACHTPPNFTSRATYDVGLSDGLRATRLNPPSLRGVSQRAPYFHDNRAATLRDVFEQYHHGDTADLEPAELFELLAFLRSL